MIRFPSCKEGFCRLTDPAVFDGGNLDGIIDPMPEGKPSCRLSRFPFKIPLERILSSGLLSRDAFLIPQIGSHLVFWVLL
jgi:hypothetical protein